MVTSASGEGQNTLDRGQDTALDGERLQLIQEKLDEFQHLEAEFKSCFRFLQEIQGQRRLPEVAVAQSVRLLHALWICERKDRLFSVPIAQDRYDGRHCLELLQVWQEGDTASVVEFLQRKLDNLSCADITAEMARARASGDVALAERLAHGRSVMLNRGFHLMRALDAIFALSDSQLTQEVRRACRDFGHTPSQIASQLAGMVSRLYMFVPHPRLARRNMMIMNELGISVVDSPADLPGNRTARVQAPTLPHPSYAELSVVGEVTLV